MTSGRAYRLRSALHAREGDPVHRGGRVPAPTWEHVAPTVAYYAALVARYAPWVGRDDLYQEAALAALEAMPRWSPERGSARRYLGAVEYRRLHRYVHRLALPVPLPPAPLASLEARGAALMGDPGVDYWVPGLSPLEAAWVRVRAAQLHPGPGATRSQVRRREIQLAGVLREVL